jgi:hypothetical protein
MNEKSMGSPVQSGLPGFARKIIARAVASPGLRRFGLPMEFHHTSSNPSSGMADKNSFHQ